MEPSLILFGKLLLATFLGAMIGTERAVLARQSAGTRTFGLVALGSCLFALTAQQIEALHPGLSGINPTQMAAAIVSGVGFLGAGLIIFRGGGVHGMTTAAGLWIAAAIGLATAYGMYEIALFSTLLSLVVFTGMWYVENRFKSWASAVEEE